MFKASRVGDQPREDFSIPGSARDVGFEPGGQVGLLQSELARRLILSVDEPAPFVAEPFGERLIRAISIAAGYGSLVGAVVLVGFVVW